MLWMILSGVYAVWHILIITYRHIETFRRFIVTFSNIFNRLLRKGWANQGQGNQVLREKRANQGQGNQDRVVVVRRRLAGRRYNLRPRPQPRQLY